MIFIIDVKAAMLKNALTYLPLLENETVICFKFTQGTFDTDR